MEIDRTKEAYHLAQNFMFPLCLYREDRHWSSNDHDARVGIANTLINRSLNPRGPYKNCNDILSNILCPYQYSSFNQNDNNARVIPSPFDQVEWPVWEDCADIAYRLQNQVVRDPDPTLGSTHYHSYPDDRHDLWPSWAQDQYFKVKIGPMRFYEIP